MNIERDKSFVDDLDIERGIVSVRVTFVLRSTEIQPIVLVICHENKRYKNKFFYKVLFCIFSIFVENFTFTHALLKPPQTNHPKQTPPRKNITQHLFRMKKYCCV